MIASLIFAMTCDLTSFQIRPIKGVTGKFLQRLELRRFLDGVSGSDVDVKERSPGVLPRLFSIPTSMIPDWA
jgi:hypothetical protein